MSSRIPRMALIPLVILIIGVVGYIVLDINGAQNTITNAGEDMLDTIMDAGEGAAEGFESVVDWAVAGITYQVQSIQVFGINMVRGFLNRIYMAFNDIMPGTSWDIPMQEYLEV